MQKETSQSKKLNWSKQKRLTCCSKKSFLAKMLNLKLKDFTESLKSASEKSVSVKIPCIRCTYSK